MAAWGAQGGGGEGTLGVIVPGGSAANFNVSVIVDAPLVIVAVVGSTGGDEPPERARGGCGGGGGGSFIYTVANEPLLMAGGGGGESSFIFHCQATHMTHFNPGSCFSGMAGGPPASGAASPGRNSGGAAGQNGQGGGIAIVDPGVGGGGAGFLSSGMPESNPASGRSKDLNFRGGSPAIPFGGGPGGFGGGGAGGGGGGGGGTFSHIGLPL